MGPQSDVSPTKEGGSRLRSSSDGSRYSRPAGGLRGNPSSPVLCNPRSVLKRPVSTEELQAPGGPFVKKKFTIVGDALGWGFVVRGNRPCHIQAVEPTGPAAAAGMKVRQFVVSVNGVNVLNLDYRTVSYIILTGPRIVAMEVMEEAETRGVKAKTSGNAISRGSRGGPSGYHLQASDRQQALEF